jgi:hypothetical protein
VIAPSEPSARRSRGRHLVAAALLTGFVVLRLVAAHHQAIPLTEPEELLNLRLARQILGGYEVGPLGRYWYTGVGGPGGAGTLVLSVLYIPLVALMGPGVWTIRVMGILWALAGALLTAGIARRVFGPPGFLAGLVAALAMPPAWVGFTVMAKGNYVEAAVLTLAAAYALLRASGSDGRISAGAWSGLAGAVAAFSVWFWPSAAPPTGLLAVAVVACAVLQRRPELAIGALVGAGLGLLPSLAGIAPTQASAAQVGALQASDVLREVLSAPRTWPALVHGSLAGQPLLSLPTAPAWEWAAGWQVNSENVLRALSWALCFGLVAVGASGRLARRLLPAGTWTAGTRSVLLALALSALGLPILLGAMGVGPAYLPVRSIYFFDPRRAALVYPVWSLGWAGALVVVAGLRGRRRVVGLGIAGLLVGLQIASAATFARAGRAPSGSFHPELWLICPADTPAEEVAVCVGTVDHHDVPVLEALVADPRLVDPDLRRAALQGYGAVEREDRDCAVAAGTLPSEAPPDALEETLWMWEALGIAARGACPYPRVDSICAEPTQAVLRDACLRGAAWRELFRAPGGRR